MKDHNVTKTPFIVCSVERQEQDVRQNALDTIAFRDYLKDKGYTFKEAKGCYNATMFVVMGASGADVTFRVIDRLRMINNQ